MQECAGLEVEDQQVAMAREFGAAQGLDRRLGLAFDGSKGREVMLAEQLAGRLALATTDSLAFEHAREAARLHAELGHAEEATRLLDRAERIAPSDEARQSVATLRAERITSGQIRGTSSGTRSTRRSQPAA